jgi:hypothetical protein
MFVLYNNLLHVKVHLTCVDLTVYCLYTKSETKIDNESMIHILLVFVLGLCLIQVRWPSVETWK